MPWRLILFIICLVLLLIFAGLNMGNVSDISFGFKIFNDVPIFISLLFSFILGIVFCVPFLISNKRKKRSASQIRNLEVLSREFPEENVKQKKVRKSRKNDKTTIPGETEEPFSENNPL